MTIEGRIAVDVSFSNTASDTGMQALKRLALTSTDAYASGKVAVIAGTMTTADVTISLAPTTYKDASGSAVSFTSVSQFAFACSRLARAGAGSGLLVSDASRVAVSVAGDTAASSVLIDALFTSGTASYSLVVVGT